jgi:hypothetical protein
MTGQIAGILGQTGADPGNSTNHPPDATMLVV